METTMNPLQFDAGCGDKLTDYGTAMKVMARISAAGYKNIGLVSLQEQDQ
jgi:biopolymer transport protein TolR